MSKTGIASRVKLPSLGRPKLPQMRWSLGVSRSAVALSIAGGGLRITALRNGELDFWQHLPLEPESLEQGCILDPEDFGRRLREALDRAGFCHAPVLWALPGTVAHGRLLPIKPGAAADPSSIIAREAAWVMPVIPDEHYLFWEPLQGDAAGHMFVLAVQKVAIDRVRRACEVAGLRLWGIDLKPLALALAVGRQEALIADVEATGIEVVILAKGLPVVMRSLHLGDELADPDLAQDRLLQELSVALRLYNETNPELPLDPAAPIVLTGDLGDESLARKVAYATKHPTIEPGVPFLCPSGFPTARFMVNLGLLLKER